MTPKDYLCELNSHLSYLYTFARQINELDFAASLSGEFRGDQDAGWSTTITAHEVFDELITYTNNKTAKTKAELRIILMLYCQLAEAGGVYETIKNIMGVVSLKPYLLWPFKDLVRVKKEPRRVIGPNANATFRDLATTAKAIGLSRLSLLLEEVFRDDIRNSIYHADYVIWNDGLRLRNRNGGYASKLSFEEVSDAITRSIGFFQVMNWLTDASIKSFNPAKEIVGRFSENFPMPWTVAFDPEIGTFGISGSSPGPATTPEYERQIEINGRLGGKVLATFSAMHSSPSYECICEHIQKAGFEPNNVVMAHSELDSLVRDIDRLNLWDRRKPHSVGADVLLASPWGFRWLRSSTDFDLVLGKPIVEFDFGEQT
ncbi:MAG: hypothetical protein ACOY6K_17360 [Pseudomonadota bacterium]